MANTDNQAAYDYSTDPQQTADQTQAEKDTEQAKKEKLAAGVVGGVGAGLSAIPVAGPIIAALAGVTSGVLTGVAASKQKKAAQLLANQYAPLQALRPEYQRKLNLDEMTAAMTAPGYQTAVNQLGASTAQNLRAIYDRSPSGAATLSAMSNALYQKNQGLERLNTANQDYRAKSLGTVGSDLEMIGGKQRELEIQQHADQALINAGALNMQNAGTANMMTAGRQIIDSVGALGKMNMSNPQSTNFADAQIAQFKRLGYSVDGNGNLVKNTQADASYTGGAIYPQEQPNTTNTYSPVTLPQGYDYGISGGSNGTGVSTIATGGGGI